MGKEDKFYDLRSALESALAEFKEVCEADERDFEEEVNELLEDVKR